MSEIARLPGPAPGSPSVATPGATRATRATTRAFAPTLQGSYRRDGLDTNAALAALRDRRAQALPARAPAAAATPVPETPPSAPINTPLVSIATAGPLEQPPQQVPVAQQQAPFGPPADHIVDVNIGGVPTRMAVSELARGYMRALDYTQKTQMAADQLRQAQQSKQAFDNARAILEQRLPGIVAAGSRFEQPIDWQRIAREDPIGYSRLDAEYKAWQAAKAEQAALVQLRQNEEYQQKRQIQAVSHGILDQTIPGWSDPGTRAQYQQLLINHLADVGFTPDEIQRTEILDPRHVVITEESRRFRAIVRAHPELLRDLGARPAAQPIVHTMQGNGLLQQRGGDSGDAATAYEHYAQLRDDPRISAGARREAAVAVIAARRRNIGSLAPLARRH